MLIELSIIVVLIVFQSVFGVGLLLFGTPIFLFLGFSFVDTLNLLLPVSITISVMQFYYDKQNISIFVKEFNTYCLPYLVIITFITLHASYLFNFKIMTSSLLIVSSLSGIFYKKLNFNIKPRFNKLSFLTIGVIHGMTNMGGAFLSIYSSIRSKDNKKLTRKYISYGYLIMGIFQYIVLLILEKNNLNFIKIFYLFFAIVLYFPTQKVFKNINNNSFHMVLYFIAISYGLTMFYFSLYHI